MAWVNIVITSKADFQKALRAGSYLHLEETGTPVRVTVQDVMICFPSGVTVYALRELCSRLSINIPTEVKQL